MTIAQRFIAGTGQFTPQRTTETRKRTEDRIQCCVLPENQEILPENFSFGGDLSGC
jgi:hypothetical protein